MKNIFYKIVMAVTGFWLFSMGMMSAGQASQPVQKYGILGQKAPELTSEYWVDENSDPAKGFLLSDYKGKVIYMLFFQDW